MALYKRFWIFFSVWKGLSSVFYFQVVIFPNISQNVHIVQNHIPLNCVNLSHLATYAPYILRENIRNVQNTLIKPKSIWYSFWLLFQQFLSKIGLKHTHFTSVRSAANLIGFITHRKRHVCPLWNWKAAVNLVLVIFW